MDGPPSTPWYHARYAGFQSFIRASGRQTSWQDYDSNPLEKWCIGCLTVTKQNFHSGFPICRDWSPIFILSLTPFTGDHLWLWPDKLQGLSDQVEQCSGDHVQPVPGSWGGQMSARPLWAAGTPHRERNEEIASLPRAAVGLVSVAPWRADRKGWRSFSVKVSIWHFCVCVCVVCVVGTLMLSARIAMKRVKTVCLSTLNTSVVGAAAVTQANRYWTPDLSSLSHGFSRLKMGRRGH